MAEGLLRSGIIQQIERLFGRLNPPAGGIILNSCTTQEIGINCHDYQVLGRHGFYTGHWTDKLETTAGEVEIVRAILEEDCVGWALMDDEELENHLAAWQAMIED